MKPEISIDFPFKIAPQTKGCARCLCWNDVYLDGKKLEFCVFGDADLGIAICLDHVYTDSENVRFKKENGKMVPKVMRGTVEIRDNRPSHKETI